MCFIYSFKENICIHEVRCRFGKIKSFHYHPTYAAYKDNRNGVIYLYMCNFKNDINLAYDWLKLS